MTLPCKRSEVEFVVWKDAMGSSSRATLDALKQVSLAVNTNLGWVVSENDERIVLAHGVSDTGEIDHFVIPVNCIVERIRLSQSKATGRRRQSSASSSYKNGKGIERSGECESRPLTAE